MKGRAHKGLISLWKHLYLSSVGMYGTIGCFFGMRYSLQTVCDIGYFSATFLSFLTVIFLRGLYEAIIVQNVPMMLIRIRQFLGLALLSTLILVPLLYAFQIPFGDWSIIVALAIVPRIIGRVRSYIWAKPLVDPDDSFRKLAAEKTVLYLRGLYAFLGAIAILTYAGVYIFGPSCFIAVFSFVLFVALILHQLYEWTMVYDQAITGRILFWYAVAGCLGSIFTTALLIFFKHELGWTWKIAAIVALIACKMLQPVLTKKLLAIS